MSISARSWRASREGLVSLDVNEEARPGGPTGAPGGRAAAARREIVAAAAEQPHADGRQAADQRGLECARLCLCLCVGVGVGHRVGLRGPFGRRLSGGFRCRSRSRSRSRARLPLPGHHGRTRRRLLGTGRVRTDEELLLALAPALGALAEHVCIAAREILVWARVGVGVRVRVVARVRVRVRVRVRAQRSTGRRRWMVCLDGTMGGFPGGPKAHLVDGDGMLVCLDVRAYRARDSISRRAEGAPGRRRWHCLPQRGKGATCGEGR